jgi:putative ABC transport system permease protein
VKPADLCELAARNLRESLLRNFLTTLGIGVGVASLVAMLSLGVGLQRLASARLAHSGLFDTVIVTPRSNLRGFDRTAGEAMSPGEPARLLDAEARQAMEELPNVVEVYSPVRFSTEVQLDGKPFLATVTGIPDSSRTSDAFDGIDGRFFASATADEAILQLDFAKSLSEQPSTLPGKSLVVRYAERHALDTEDESSGVKKGSSGDGEAGFSIVPKEKTLRIVGIVENDPVAGGGGYGRGRLYIPLEVAQTLQATQVNDLQDVLRTSGGSHTFATLTLRARSPSDVGRIEDSVKQMGFSAFSLLDATRNLRMFFAIFDLLLGIFGSLALAVATLGIVNTLVMAILERRREIGVLKALGAADRDVKQLFFAEAGVMGLLGGILGVAMGWVIGKGVTWGTNIYLKRQNLPSAHVFLVPWWLVGGAICFAVLVSLLAGLYPASRAAKLNPVEALRYE